MAGTPYGGYKASLVNKERHGEDFYKRIGSMGGKKGTTGGFFANVQCYCDEFKEPHVKRRCAGAKGGRVSRRTKRVA